MIAIQGFTKHSHVFKAVATAIVAALIASCGGAGTGTDIAGGVDSGGTGITNTVVLGPVTGLGSAIVNGIRFDVSTATIVDDEGKVVAPDQIYLGQIARIESATVDTVNGASLAKALSVQIRSQIIGNVDSVDLNTNTLTVVGQAVLISPATWFDPTLTSGFSSGLVGSMVEVYGQFDPYRSQYVATRITLHTDHTAFKLSGILTSLDTSNKVMGINGIAISYASIPDTSMPTLLLGDLIQTRFATKPVANVWKAQSVAIAHISLPDRHDVRMSGRITAWSSTRSFHLDGIKVDARNAIFIGAESGVALGSRVTVIGAAQKGELIATELTVVGDETAQNSTFELHGPVVSLDTAAKTMLVHGIKVLYSGQIQLQSGTLNDLADGHQIMVTGSLSTDKLGVVAKLILFE